MVRLMVACLLALPVALYPQTRHWNLASWHIPTGAGFWLPGDVCQSVNGEVYAAGLFNSVFKRNPVLLKLLPDGAPAWCKRIFPDSTQYTDEVFINPFSNGQMAVAWTADNRSGILAVNAAGDIVWSKVFSKSPLYLWGMVVSGSKAYVCGSLGQQPFSACVDASGNLLWANVFKENLLPAEQRSSWRNVAQGQDGRLLLMGISGQKIPSGVTVQSALVAETDSAGHFLWSVKGDQAWMEYAVQTPAGDWIMGGNLNYDYDLGFALLLRPQGELAWAKKFARNDPDNPLLGMLGLATDQAGNAVMSLSGASFGLGTYKSFCWANIDGEGRISEVRRHFQPAAKRVAMTRWKRSPTGTLFASGIYEFQNPQKPNEMTLLQIPADGSFPTCCAAPDSLLAIDVPFSFLPYGTTGESVFGWQDLSYQEDVLVPEIEFHCLTESLALEVSDTLICPGECVTLRTGSVPDSSANIQWQVNGEAWPGLEGLGSQVFCPEGPAVITLEGEVPLACHLFHDTVRLAIRERPFPNAFTPDGDGMNDIFRPEVFCNVSDYHLEVFSRWGKKVFETVDPAEGWNGRTDGQPLPVDVYAWQLSYTFKQKGRPTAIKRHGEVSLLR